MQLEREKVTQLKEATAQDSVLADLIDITKHGRPQENKMVAPQMRPYFHHRDEIVEADGLLFRGKRCIIPASLRSQVLKKIHYAHTGEEGCLRLAHEHIFWPGMSAEIKNMIETCEACQSLRKRQQRETLIPTEVQDIPWKLVAVDIFLLLKQNAPPHSGLLQQFLEGRFTHISNKQKRDCQAETTFCTLWSS